MNKHPTITVMADFVKNRNIQRNKQEASDQIFEVLRLKNDPNDEVLLDIFDSLTEDAIQNFNLSNNFSITFDDIFWIIDQESEIFLKTSMLDLKAYCDDRKIKYKDISIDEINDVLIDIKPIYRENIYKIIKAHFLKITSTDESVYKQSNNILFITWRNICIRNDLWIHLVNKYTQELILKWYKKGEVLDKLQIERNIIINKPSNKKVESSYLLWIIREGLKKYIKNTYSINFK